jgi:succinate dehydrogenase / fumarate reductase flavoprotein subunit
MQWETLQQLENTQKGAFFKSLLHTNSPNMYSCSRRSSIKLTLMSESLRDGRIWVPAKLEDAVAIRDGKKKTNRISEEDRDYLERRYPFGSSSS